MDVTDQPQLDNIQLIMGVAVVIGGGDTPQAEISCKIKIKH